MKAEMNFPSRTTFFVLIALVGILAASTSFLAAQNYLGSKPKESLTPAVGAATGVNGAQEQALSSPQAQASSVVSRPASASEKPSHPSDTCTVQRGETLFAIAQAQGTTWQDMAEANGIAEVNKIQAGQILIVPKAGQVNFTIDESRSASLQKDADIGKYQFRLDPLESARSDAPPVYGLAVTDNYTLKNKDLEKGQAQVQSSHEGKNYLITLSQPVTKGDKGIWVIISIRPL